MSQADLVADLKAALSDAANIFTAAADADFERHLSLAALDFARVRPRTLVGSVTVEADVQGYSAPSDCLEVKVALWGRDKKRSLRPWDAAWPGRLPYASVVEEGGARKVWLDPAPTSAQITLLGSTYSFYYFAAHSIGTAAADTTIQAGDRHLLLLRAGAEAMLELTKRGAGKPVTLRGEFAGVAKANTPAALYDSMMTQFERQAGMAA